MTSVQCNRTSKAKPTAQVLETLKKMTRKPKFVVDPCTIRSYQNQSQFIGGGKQTKLIMVDFSQNILIVKKDSLVFPAQFALFLKINPSKHLQNIT